MAGEPGFDDITKRFSALWQSLTRTGDAWRSGEERRLLTDRVRDALDRGESRLSDMPANIIANTFTIENKVHDSALTRIHKVRHRDLGSLHAVKTLHPDHADDPVSRRLFLREAEMGLSLRHAHIITTQALLRLQDGRPAIILEWCQGTLADRLASGAISVDDISKIMIGILEGLSAIHEQSIVHCDLSPSNVLFSGEEGDTVKIADFGIALSRDENHHVLDLRFAGNRHFAAPEQKEASVMDHRADLFAAGRILSSMLQVCDDAEAISLHALAGHLSQPLPQDRPENAKAALRMLGGL